VGILPETIPEDPHPVQGCIALVDSRGRTVYRWGGYQPVPDETPVAELPLSPPLGSWRLTYHLAPPARGASLAWSLNVALVTGLGALVVALAVMGTYLYRESSRAAREALQRVTFVNQVSHELKTPLTSIRMFAELLQDHIGDDEKAQRHLNVVVTESHRLTRLIANVLTLGRRQRDQLSIRRSPVVVDDVISAVADRFRPTLAQKKIDILLDLHAADEICVDADAVDQILGNLLSNVEKYASFGRHVTISSAQNRNGPGCV
jgi:Signal transduction histidine kinase